jgi:hypothetical protein
MSSQEGEEFLSMENNVVGLLFGPRFVSISIAKMFSAHF